MVSAVSTTGMFKESVVSMRLPPDCLAWMVVVEERRQEREKEEKRKRQARLEAEEKAKEQEQAILLFDQQLLSAMAAEDVVVLKITIEKARVWCDENGCTVRQVSVLKQAKKKSLMVLMIRRRRMGLSTCKGGPHQKLASASLPRARLPRFFHPPQASSVATN
jgi:hypothetical protein